MSELPSETVQAFLGAYFRERTRLIREELERRAPFRQMFFAEDCAWDSRTNLLSDSETETILEIAETNEAANVITSGFSSHQTKLLYELISVGSSWKIREVHFECKLCRIRGQKLNCSICKGSGWMGYRPPSRTDHSDPGSDRIKSE